MKIEHVTDSWDGDLVVFLLGMQVRKPWRVDQWGFVSAAMLRMQTELEKNKARAEAGDVESLGYLGGFNCLGAGGPFVVQYWRSVDDLEAYAHSDDHAHRGAWLRLYRLASRQRSSGIGLWHETYAVPAGSHETIYGQMSAIGLGKAAGSMPLVRRGRTARERLTPVA